MHDGMRRSFLPCAGSEYAPSSDTLGQLIRSVKGAHGHGGSITRRSEYERSR
jgi:hypothetical protein